MNADYMYSTVEFHTLIQYYRGVPIIRNGSLELNIVILVQKWFRSELFDDQSAVRHMYGTEVQYYIPEYGTISKLWFRSGSEVN